MDKVKEKIMNKEIECYQAECRYGDKDCRILIDQDGFLLNGLMASGLF